MSFVDCLNARSNIYRLQDGTNYDFSQSEEGEVNEVWAIVSLNTKCRVDVDHVSVKRRSDGPVDLGTRKIFFDGRTDVRNGDRIYRNGEHGAEQYEVVDATPIDDFDKRIHHWEVTAKFTDWSPPAYMVLWVGEVAFSNVLIKEKIFGYRDTYPLSIVHLASGSRIMNVSVQIKIPFNDPAAFVTVGYGDIQDNLISSDMVDLGSVEVHEEVENILMDAYTAVKIYADVGESTEGSGIVFVESVTMEQP
jgi:hypothetical protein